MHKLRVLVLGAGFGGLELSTMLSEMIGDRLDLKLIDKSDFFHFGFSKFDMMFGYKSPDIIKLDYQHIHRPGVRFLQETITAIEPEAKRVTTDQGTYDADVLVVALGADYDIGGTPGLAEGGNEFYSFEGALRLREVLPAFSKGHAIVGVTAVPFKCPPGPSEAVLLLHQYLLEKGVRDQCKLSLIMPYETPVPPSPDTSKALMNAFKERNIDFIPCRLVKEIDPNRHVAILDNGAEIGFNLFMAIPKHKVPDVVEQSGLAENGWIPVDPNTLKTKIPGVYAFGDVATLGVPKAGVFAEREARVAAESIVADFLKSEQPRGFKGDGTCYIEFGAGMVGRIDVDFNYFADPVPSTIFSEPSRSHAGDKQQFGYARALRWFGIETMTDAEDHEALHKSPEQLHVVDLMKKDNE
jgi:sulfide:quinone oxidoreductase